MSRRPRLVAAFALGSLLLARLQAGAATTQLVAVAERVVAARQKMMQANATPADVQAFLALATEDLVYEDPVVKMKIEGREDIASGLTSFLGQTRNAKIVVHKRIAAANVVVFDQTVSFDAKQDDGGWKPQTRDQVTIFEFEGSRLRRVADYWSR
jgi:ketosteroid isomerase-like protein